MSKGVYVAGTAPRSGKSIVSLGFMELFSASAEKVGFFRPVAAGRDDSVIRLMDGRYTLGVDPELLFGATVAEARELAAVGREEALIQRILDRFKALEARFDHVVCEGSDFSISIPGLEFDFNAELANQLGCLMVPVLHAGGRSEAELLDHVRVVVGSLEERGCDVLAAVVNRVAAEGRDAIAGHLAGREIAGVPVYVLPEHPILDMPTVGEVAVALGAEQIGGPAEALTREIAHFKVAAMELPHFLDHLEEGSLVITPGDRSDIIAGCITADHSLSYPRVAGLVLTGDLRPAPQIERLIGGLSGSGIPMLSVPGDTFTTATEISSVESSLGPDNPRKIAAALGVLEGHMDSEQLRARIELTRPARITPLQFEYELIQRAKRRRMHIVLPEGDEERILRAAEILLLRGVAQLTVLGDPETIRRRIAALGLRLEQLPIIDPTHSPLRERYADALVEARRHKGVTRQMAWDMVEDLSYFGTMMVHCGDADGMVSGAVHTTQHTIRPAFQVIRTRPGHNFISSVFLMSLRDRVLVYGDCAVNPDPDAAQLAEIALASAATAAQFGIEPRVAMLSYSTGESGQGASVEKVREAVRIAHRRAPQLKLEGPLQYDAAVDVAVARTKLPESEVAGHATVFIFPDLNTGNNTYKAVQRSAGAVAIGPILQGLNKPVNDLSRGCTVTDIVNTVAITAIQAQELEGPADGG